MRKKVFYVLILLLVIINYGCKNTFEPNAAFRERYVLTGVMRSDTSLQIVTITHTYRPEGTNPNSYTNPPYVVGAEVDMWYKYKLYELRDTVLTRLDTSRYKGPVHCYYVKGLRPDPGEYVDIQALLPNGLLLQSTTQLPDADSLTFFDSASDLLIPSALHANNIYVGWQPLGLTYSPRIEIIYYKAGDTTPHAEEVPLQYYNNNGKITPVYPPTSTSNQLVVDLPTIEQALQSISPDSAKHLYTIAEMDFTVITYDQYLSTYYYSIQNLNSGYTVTLNEPDFTNVKGGYGIFGSYVKRTFKLTFTRSFLQQNGY